MRQSLPRLILPTERDIKGKGISFMENKAEWHGKAPKEQEYNQAMEELQ